MTPPFKGNKNPSSKGQKHVQIFMQSQHYSKKRKKQKHCIKIQKQNASKTLEYLKKKRDKDLQAQQLNLNRFDRHLSERF